MHWLPVGFFLCVSLYKIFAFPTEMVTYFILEMGHCYSSHFIYGQSLWN